MIYRVIWLIRQKTFNRLLKKIDEKEGTLLSKFEDIKTLHSKVRIRCKKGHIWNPQIDQIIYQNQWCPECNYGKRKLESYNKLEEIVRQKEGKLNTFFKDYEGIRTWINITCKNGHTWKIKASSIIYDKCWCQECIKKETKYKNEKWLRHQYLDLKLSTHELAKICRCSALTIYNWLRNFNIEIRSLSESCKIAQNRPEVKAKRSEISTRLWEDTQYRNDMIEAQNRPEVKRKKSESQKISMNQPEVIEKHRKDTTERWKDPQYRNDTTKKIKEAMNRPEVIEKNRKSAIEIWKDSKYRNQHTGENNHNWNPDREQVFAPYTEIFYDEEFRRDIRKFQLNRDLLDGSLLDDNSELHHFSKDKGDDSHFCKEDSYCNLGFLNVKNHRRCDSIKKYKFYTKLLRKNCEDLRDGKIPESWIYYKKENNVVQKGIKDFI